ncbi:helix-turn-helix domain-containing protein [Weissella cibaria]|uniref:helix-turn-helix domain-containing protein n=1 Tax=Weissella cibaria TaxID=137591 RepID=UPI001D04D43B|nr:helix-turn-helix transcriptional regulator [Weissella cibaria]MCB5826621.1 helix-turn-helix domain-containing protein [Weissella cibaria]MCB5858202.1 helix-turn-helix domain-containing protein [Weissella cibaria]MCB5861376.1 helix-turn-helix domain-containing protein [Weissella cibaria]MCB5862344.1 helix-turn-helix domain-containing protein [Weissella cibaria]MCB5865893.1 helix-turn-helix domain-containing protein [Weissella cibaria]
MSHTNRLKELRKNKGITQKQMSKDLDIPQNTLSNYENGNRNPTVVTWNALADYFGVSVPYLRGEIDFPNGLSDAEFDEILDKYGLLSEQGSKAFDANQYSKDMELTTAILRRVLGMPSSERQNQRFENLLRKSSAVPTRVHSTFLDSIANVYAETMDQSDSKLQQTLFETNVVLRALHMPKDVTSWEQDDEVLHKVFDLVNELRPGLVNSTREFIHDQTKELSNNDDE